MCDEITIECVDCQGEYSPDNEGPEDHDEDCPVRKAFIDSGRWEEP